MDYLFIEELRVQASVGIYPREKAKLQMIEMSLVIGMPDSATRSDSIAATINYADVIGRIRAELTERHFNLVETVGHSVAKILLDEFGAPWVKIRIGKIGLFKGVRRIGVHIERAKDGIAPPASAM